MRPGDRANAEDILKGFSGVLQVPSHGLQANHCRAPDGYAGYNRLLKPADRGIELAYCWAHAPSRACKHALQGNGRKLHEVAKNSTAAIAEDGLRRIAALYRIEADIRGQDPEVRLAARQERSSPKITEFENWLTDRRARVSAKSPLGEALKYIAEYWGGLRLFVIDGRIEMDGNAVERTIRPIALNRKNALFAGHDAGAQNWGVIASLIETCKLNSVDPHAYLKATLSAIVNGRKQSQIDDLLRWNHAPHV
jgi:hypothetical protein